MAKRWLFGTFLVLGMLPTPGPAQLFNLGSKPPQSGDQGNAFAFDKPLPTPEFAPDTSKGQPPGPQFAGPRGVTPFVPMDEEDRNGFLDYVLPGSRPSPPLLFWARGDYLNWQFKDGNIAAIVATTSVTPSVTSNFGALGQSGTRVLVPAGPFAYDRFNGGKVTGGFSLAVPIEIGGFWMHQDHTIFQASSDGSLGSQLLSIPFQAPNLNLAGTDQTIPVELASSAGFPGLASGSLSFTTTALLWGLDLNGFLPLLGSDLFFVDAYAGYRHVSLGETFTITKTLAPANPLVLIDFNGDPNGFGPGFSTITQDHFNTGNHFNGGQLGARGGLTVGRFALMVDGKLGLGQNHQILIVNGSSTLVTPASPFRGSPNVVPGGVLAVASNSGFFSRDVFSVMPQAEVNLGFQLFRSVRLFAGYSMLWWSNVVRPGDQISNSVDSTQIPTNGDFSSTTIGTSPAPRFVMSNFWAQGYNFGILIGF